MGKVGRNDPCPCGSGKKYKKCCLPLERQKRWSVEEVRSLSTKEIISKLGSMGITITEESFLEEVGNFYSAYDLAENWWKIYPVTAKGFDQDFPWMAAVVLWERLAPHVMNSEKLDHMMQEGYNLCDEGKEVEGCRIWLKVWEHLKERFTPDMKSVEEAERVFKGTECLYNWCQDLEMELGNSSVAQVVSCYFWRQSIKSSRIYTNVLLCRSRHDGFGASIVRLAGKLEGKGTANGEKRIGFGW